MIFERNSDGCIKFLEPLIPIIGIFDFENEDFIDEFIQICKYSGDSLLPYLVEYVRKKKGRGLSYAFQAIHNLGCYWTTKPEIRIKVILALNELIESPENETPQFNSYVIDSLLECNAVESYHLIKRCYKLKCVDESFVEWERVKSTLDIDSNSTIENNNDENNTLSSSISSDEEENSENENENENKSKILKNKKNSENNKKNGNENGNEHKNKNDNCHEESDKISKKQKEQNLEKREINQRLTNEKFLKEKERDLKEKELKIKNLHREFENKIQFFHQRKSQNENVLLNESEEYKKNIEKWILQLKEEDGDFDLSVDAELKECSFCKKKKVKVMNFWFVKDA